MYEDTSCAYLVRQGLLHALLHIRPEEHTVRVKRTQTVCKPRRTSASASLCRSGVAKSQVRDPSQGHRFMRGSVLCRIEKRTRASMEKERMERGEEWDSGRPGRGWDSPWYPIGGLLHMSFAGALAWTSGSCVVEWTCCDCLIGEVGHFFWASKV